MKRAIKDWLIVLVLLLDDAAALALVILVLWFFGVRIPLPIMIVLGLLLGTAIFIIHRAVLPTFHKKKVTGREGMVGLTGTVIKPLTPVGVIQIGSEYWKAKSVNENIDAGEEVEILSLNGLTLTVRLKD